MASTSLDAAMLSVRAGARVVPSPYCATPDTLLRGLARRAESVPGLVLDTGLLLGGHPYADAVRAGALRCRSWHLAGPARRLAAEGLVDYVACRASDVPALVGAGVDVALVRVSPPDSDGRCGLGPSGSYGRALVAGAALVIGEVDEAFPRTCGPETTVHVSQIDHLVESDTPTPTYGPSRTGPETARIVRTVLDLLPLGAAVQVGIGAVPEAVAGELAASGERDLRLVGLGVDSMVAALRTPGVRLEVAELMGTAALFAAADGNPAVRLLPSRTVHDARWLGGIPRLVSVCSALQVDLSGQVASEAVDGVPLSGIGGSADFSDGARLSPGGLRIVALPATTPAGASRISAALGPGTPVTIPRHGVDVVVTEFGAAVLAGRSLRERAEALVAIAHPDHRGALAGPGRGARRADPA